YPLAGGNPQAVLAELKSNDLVIDWEADGKGLLVGQRGSPFVVRRVYLNSSRDEAVRSFFPADAAGIVGVGGIRFSADRKSYAYSYYGILSDLYVVDGLK